MSFQNKEPPQAATLPISGKCKGMVCAPARTDLKQAIYDIGSPKAALRPLFAGRTM